MKYIILIFIFFTDLSSCIKINNIFKKKCSSIISINRNNVNYISGDFLEKNDNFYIYLEGQKSFKAKIIKQYNFENKDQENDTIENDFENTEIQNHFEYDVSNNFESNEVKSNEVSIEEKNKIISSTSNILSLILVLFIYLSINSYMFGMKLREKYFPF